jgi:hypothetical protein
MKFVCFLAKYLSAYKIKALPYHAGLTDSKRQLVQNQWANDDCQVRRDFNEKGLVFWIRLFVQQLLLEWVLINQMFVLLFIFRCQNQLKFELNFINLLKYDYFRDIIKNQVELDVMVKYLIVIYFTATKIW